jgi:hypothetical protein
MIQSYFRAYKSTHSFFMSYNPEPRARKGCGGMGDHSLSMPRAPCLYCREDGHIVDDSPSYPLCTPAAANAISPIALKDDISNSHGLSSVCGQSDIAPGRRSPSQKARSKHLSVIALLIFSIFWSRVMPEIVYQRMGLVLIVTTLTVSKKNKNRY